jgi:hypothetical protein
MRHGHAESLRKRKLAYILEIVKSISKVLGSMIDFGCSTGALIDLLNEVLGRYGVEIDGYVHKVCEK